MVVVHNYLGGIEFTKPFFVSLISNTVMGCMGVSAMNASTPAERLADIVPITASLFDISKGVNVRIKNNKVSIEIHISVMYGVNIPAIVSSIRNKLKYVVEEQTRLSVDKIEVYIDGLTY